MSYKETASVSTRDGKDEKVRKGRVCRNAVTFLTFHKMTGERPVLLVSRDCFSGFPRDDQRENWIPAPRSGRG